MLSPEKERAGSAPQESIAFIGSRAGAIMARCAASAMIVRAAQVTRPNLLLLSVKSCRKHKKTKPSCVRCFTKSQACLPLKVISSLLKACPPLKEISSLVRKQTVRFACIGSRAGAISATCADLATIALEARARATHRKCQASTRPISLWFVGSTAKAPRRVDTGWNSDAIVVTVAALAMLALGDLARPS